MTTNLDSFIEENEAAHRKIKELLDQLMAMKRERDVFYGVIKDAHGACPGCMDSPEDYLWQPGDPID